VHELARAGNGGCRLSNGDECSRRNADLGNTFGLSDQEVYPYEGFEIKNWVCSVNTHGLAVSGKLYLFATKIGFQGRALGIRKKIFVIDMKRVAGVVYAKALWLPSAIKIILTSGESVKFSGFINRDEAMKELNRTLDVAQCVEMHESRAKQQTNHVNFTLAHNYLGEESEEAASSSAASGWPMTLETVVESDSSMVKTKGTSHFLANYDLNRSKYHREQIQYWSMNVNALT